MCILSGTPERVSKTQILAFHTDDGKHQVTVYANEVRLARSVTTTFVPWGESGGDNGGDVATCAMVLPFPANNSNNSNNSNNGGCEMIDTTGIEGENEGLFKALDDLFPVVMTYGGTRGGFGISDGASTLEVKTCGSYDYSVAPTLDDLSRLDASLHIEDVHDLLRRMYGTGFSFLVCAIRKSAKYHPIAYKHVLRDDGRLFLPTLHEHGTALRGGPMWDHSIYSVRPGQPSSGTGFGNLSYARDWSTVEVEVAFDDVSKPLRPSGTDPPVFSFNDNGSYAKTKEVGLQWAALARALGPALAKNLGTSASGSTLKKTTIVGNHPNEDILI